MPWPGESDDYGKLWDSVTLGDFLLPGLCFVEVDRSVEIERAKPGNSTGAQLKLKGTKLADVTIDWRVWTAAQWDEMQEILTQLESLDGKKELRSWTMFNPVTFNRGIYSVAIEKIQGPTWDSKGFMGVKLKCVEWNPPPPKTKGVGTVKSEWAQAPDKDGTIQVGVPVNTGTGYQTVNVPKTKSVEDNKPSKTQTDP